MLYDELKDAYGNFDVEAFHQWRALFQRALRASDLELGHLEIGGKGEWVVFDETRVGVHPRNGFESVSPKRYRQFHTASANWSPAAFVCAPTHQEGASKANVVEEACEKI